VQIHYQHEAIEKAGWNTVDLTYISHIIVYSLLSTTKTILGTILGTIHIKLLYQVKEKGNHLGIGRRVAVTL
jgi:hypothetical protein